MEPISRGTGSSKPSHFNSEFLSVGPADAVGQNLGSGQLKGQRSGQCGLSTGTRRRPGLATQIQICALLDTLAFRYCSYRSHSTTEVSLTWRSSLR
jgi:hypothetical protein